MCMGIGNLRPKGHFWKFASTQNCGKLRPAFLASWEIRVKRLWS